jgi:hypothetical protein
VITLLFTEQWVLQEFEVLWPKLAAVFDAGKISSPRTGSTVVDLSVPGQFNIIRQGQYVSSNTTMTLIVLTFPFRNFEKTLAVLKSFNLVDATPVSTDANTSSKQ